MLYLNPMIMSDDEMCEITKTDNNNKKKVNARHTHDHRIDRFQTNTTTSK